MGSDFLSIKITEVQAAQIALELYGLQGQISSLPGELDFNFRIASDSETFLMKISRPYFDNEYIEFQQELLNHVGTNNSLPDSPRLIQDLHGNQLSEIKDDSGLRRKVRLISWIEGRLWSEVNPISHQLLYSLGVKAGSLTNSLKNFDHPMARRAFEWDLAQAHWTFDQLHLFKQMLLMPRK